MSGHLLFSFHPAGCNILLCQDGRTQLLAEMTVLDLLRLGMEADRMFLMMEGFTDLYFVLKGKDKTPVPPAFYEAFREGDIL